MKSPYTFTQTRLLPNELMNDMEFNQSNDLSQNSIFELLYKPTCGLEQELAQSIGGIYSCDASFLTTTGHFISTWSIDNEECPYDSFDTRDQLVVNEFEETFQYLCIPSELNTAITYFKKEYPFISNVVDRIRSLNTSPAFLQGWALYNVGSPFMALATPIFFLILPFLILKILRVPITFSNYWNYVKTLFRGHSLGKLFEFSTSSISNRIYIIGSIVFYVGSMVRNTMDCMKFIQNQTLILERIRNTYNDLKWVDSRITRYINCIRSVLEKYPHQAYTQYIVHLETLQGKLREFLQEISNVLKSVQQCRHPPMTQIGKVLSLFYRIHQTNECCELFNDMIEFVGYYEIVNHIAYWYSATEMSVVEWTDTPEKSRFEDLYPITILDSQSSSTSTLTPLKPMVANNIDLSMNWIITGQNASGKTTILRSVLFNQLLSQQWGIAFSRVSKCKIYHYFHCYMNVPDSYSRDSLFQAEARRCLNVLEFIHSHQDETHFCIFDELYSGTNPVEATCGSIAYIRELNKIKNVRFLLTTHYHDILRHIGKKCRKAHMKVENNTYTYKLCDGINRDYGAIRVFNDLGYSEPFVNQVKKLIRRIG